MWSPSEPGGAGGSAGFGVAIESAANLFHGLWFLLGAMILVRAKRRWRWAAVWGVLVVAGFVFELGQVWVPGRSAGIIDASWNLVGAALGMVRWGPERADAQAPESQDCRSADQGLKSQESQDQENPDRENPCRENR